MSYTGGGTWESQLLNDVVREHQNGCKQCRENLKRRPIPNLGGNSNICSDLTEIFQSWADYEGGKNNVVACDEYGNEAPKSPR